MRLMILEPQLVILLFTLGGEVLMPYVAGETNQIKPVRTWKVEEV